LKQFLVFFWFFKVSFYENRTQNYDLEIHEKYDAPFPLSVCKQPRPTLLSIPTGSVNEYQLRLGRQKQVWFIPLADERDVQVQL